MEGGGEGHAGPPSPPVRSASRMATPLLESPDSASERSRLTALGGTAGGGGRGEEERGNGGESRKQAASAANEKVSPTAVLAQRYGGPEKLGAVTHAEEDRRGSSEEDAWGAVVERWQKVKHEAEEELNASITGPVSKRPGTAKQQIIPSGYSRSRPAEEREEDEGIEVGDEQVFVWATSPPKARGDRMRGSIEFSSSPLSTQTGRSRPGTRGELVGEIVSDLVGQAGRARAQRGGGATGGARNPQGRVGAGRSLPEVVAARMMEMRSPGWSRRGNDSTAYDTAREEEGELSSVSAEGTDTSASEAKIYALNQKRPLTRLGNRTAEASMLASPAVVGSGLWPSGGTSADEERDDLAHVSSMWTTDILEPPSEQHHQHLRSARQASNGATSVYSPLQQTCRYCAYRGSKERVLALGTHHSNHCVRFMSPQKLAIGGLTPSNTARIGGDISGHMLVSPGKPQTPNLGQKPNVWQSGSLTGSGVQERPGGLDGWFRMTEVARAELLASATATLRAAALHTCPAAEFARALGMAATSGRGRMHLMIELAPSDRACVLRGMPSALAEKVVAALPHEGRAQALAEMGAGEVWGMMNGLILEERVRTLKSLPADLQSSVFACLSGEDMRVSVLLLVAARERPTLLAGLSGAESIEILTALPPRDCVTTLRHLAPLEVEGTLIRMSPDFRDKVISAMPPKEAATLFSAMPLDSVSAVIEGISPKTLVHALRSLGPDELAALLGDMAPGQV